MILIGIFIVIIFFIVIAKNNNNSKITEEKKDNKVSKNSISQQVNYDKLYKNVEEISEEEVDLLLEYERNQSYSSELFEYKREINALKIESDPFFNSDNSFVDKVNVIEQYLLLFVEIQEKLILLAKKNNFNSYKELPLNFSFEICESYYSSLAQCYYTQKKYNEAEETLELGFKHICFFETSHNLIFTYERYLLTLLKTGEIKRFLINFKKGKTYFEYNDIFIKELEKTVVELLKSEKAKEINDLFSSSELVDKKIKNILRNATVEIEVYQKIHLANSLFKDKNYAKADQEFVKSIENAKIFQENINPYFELYGDILYKLKEYENSIKAYNVLTPKEKEDYRVCTKIGDCYKMLKQLDEAYELYLTAYNFNKNYKTVQNKLITIAKKLKKEDEIEKLINKGEDK